MTCEIRSFIKAVAEPKTIRQFFSSFETGPKENDLWANIDFFPQRSTIKYERTPNHEIESFTSSNQDRRQRRECTTLPQNTGAKEHIKSNACGTSCESRLWELKINKWSNLGLCLSNLNLMCTESPWDLDKMQIPIHWVWVGTSDCCWFCWSRGHTVSANGLGPSVVATVQGVRYQQMSVFFPA